MTFAIIFGWDKAVFHCTCPHFFKDKYYWYLSWRGRYYFLTTRARMEALQKDLQNG